jgi:LemA protein
MDYLLPVILIVVVIVVVVLITQYNRLVALKHTIDQAFADIDVQLKNRFDLVENLVNTVK